MSDDRGIEIKNDGLVMIYPKYLKLQWHFLERCLVSKLNKNTVSISLQSKQSTYRYTLVSDAEHVHVTKNL